MAEEKERLAPIQQHIHVDCPIEEAFELFTDRLTEWWPLDSHSTSGDQAEECAIEPWVGGRIFERTRSGEEREWGRVLAWEPPRRVEFTWHPGWREDLRQTVEVEFCVEADGTRVTLTHHGWHLADAQACAFAPGHGAALAALLATHFAEFVSTQLVIA